MGTASAFLLIAAGFVIFLVGIIYVIQTLNHPTNIPPNIVTLPALLALLGVVIIVVGVTRLGNQVSLIGCYPTLMML